MFVTNRLPVPSSPRRARRVITAGTNTDPLGLAINGRAKTPEKKKYGREADGFIHYDFS
jgi:hypothetical protein